MKTSRCFYACLILLLILQAAAFAQTFRAQITGVVTDQTGAVAPTAKIKATNIATGVAQTVQSNEQGVYRFVDLQPGQYRVETELTGFKKSTQESLTLQVGDIVTLDFQLQVGNVGEVVNVTSEATLLESETASVGQVINYRSIVELPLNVRDPLALITLTPGANVGPLFGAGGGTDVGRNFFKADFKVGGGRYESSDLLLDGSPNVSGDRNFTGYIPPVDSTQEFKVQTNSFSAEYGRTAGAIVNIVTRSGANDFHGVVYEFHRNSVFDANNFFNNRSGVKKGSFKRHQFGANASGPIFKDRTFFFGDYEGLRQAFPASRISTVPTALQRRGDFSQTFNAQGRLITVYDPLTTRRLDNGQLIRDPFPGNIIPANRFDPVALAILSFYPQPNLPGDVGTGANNYIFAGRDSFDINKYSGRIDHNFTANNRIFGRHSYQRSFRLTPPILEGVAGGGRSQDDRYYNTVIEDTHTFSPTLTAQLRVAFNREFPVQLGRSSGFDLTQLKLPASYVAIAEDFFPIVNISDLSSLSPDPIINAQPRDTYALIGSANKLVGKHSLKFGFDFRVFRFHALQNTNPSGTFNFNRVFTQGPNPLQASSDAGFGLASFLLGVGSGGSINHIGGISLQRLYHAYYMQDDWKVTPKLTLNLGLRYDITTGQTERYDRLAALNLDAPSPLASRVNLPLKGALEFLGVNGNPRNALDTDKNNFGPRVGVAYQLSDKLAVRAGYGVFYVPMNTFATGVLGFSSNTPWVNSIDNLTPANFLSNPYPQGFNLPKGDRDPLTNIGFAIDGNIRDEPVGYAQLWSLSLQRQFGSSFLVDAAYWGNKGTKLQYGEGFEENYLPSQFLALGTALNEQVPNPFFGIIPTGPLSGPMVARRQLLLRFPQYTSVRRRFPMAGSSIYHGLSLKAEKRLSEGLSFLVAYNWQKQLEDSSDQTGGIGIVNMENRRAERALSDFDIAHRFVASYIYELPFGRGKALGRNLHPALNVLAGGWLFSGIVTVQSGFPLGISRPSIYRENRSARLDDPTIDRWFDTSLFAPAPPFTFGNVGPVLPDVRLDRTENFDFTLAKNFFFTERFRLQFRAEFFNAFNHPQFAAPNNNVTSTTFGRIAAQANSPREMQFALKLHW